MSVSYVVVVVLLALGVLIQLICCIGVFVMRGAYPKLHYMGPASTLGIVFIAAAVVVNDGFSQAAVKAVLLAIVLVVSSPVISHATARAAKTRDETGWDDIES